MLRPVARPRNLHVLCLLGIVILVSTPVTPQESQPPATTFSSSSELVLVPTVVNDKSGAHISGLTKQDFVLKQDGKVRSIAVFEEVRTDSARVRRSRGEGGIFNNFESDGTYHRLIIIVLDLINTPLADQASAKEALVKFLLETAESGEPVCLLALTRGGLHLVHDFTDNPKLLAEALRKVQSNTAPLIPSQNVEAAHPVGDGLAATLTKLIRGELQAESQLASLERKDTALITVQGLQQIAKAFRGLPGRKALIWASSGFPFSLSPPSSLLCEPACPAEQRGDVQSAYDNAWRMMNDAQTAVYPVDLRSTDVGIPVASESTFTHPYDVGDSQFDTAAQARWQRQDTTSTLQLFAQNTGGIAFLGSNNLAQSFRKAIQDDSSYYMLAYYVAQNGTKSGWHPISIVVHQKGSQARFRNGFFFSTDRSAPSARQEIALALGSPLDFTGLPLSMMWSGQNPGKLPGQVRAQFDLVMPANFASVDESERNHMIVDIAAVAKDSNGNIFANLSQRIDDHLKPEGLEQIRTHGMTYRNGLQLPPGDYVVRFVVRDALGNRMGSLIANIKVKL